MEVDGREPNWSDTVEDLVDRGDVQGAISVLESVVSRLGTNPSPSDDLRLASALGDLANLHSSQGCSLKADDLRTRVLLIKTRAAQPHPLPPSPPAPTLMGFEPAKNKLPEQEETRVPSPSDDDEDWEAISDLAPPDVGVSNTLLEDPLEFKTPKRRGRGSFLYTKNGLYCDQVDVGTAVDDHVSSREELVHQHSGESTDIRNLRFRTSHVLVLYDFPSSTRTMDLEKLFVGSRDGTVAIRWVNDTCALAVFRTPSAAQDARNGVHLPFRVRALDEDDSLLSHLSERDLEPPLSRPKTSARTAQRLIAHGMGLKPSTDFGSSELKKQEEARKNRIQTRQILRDDAWGSDEP